MKVIAVTPFWQRPEVSEIFWAQCHEIGLDVIAIVTEGDTENIELAKKNALQVVFMPNDDLATKWQAGMEALKAYPFDFFMLLGSDDLVSHKYLKDICVPHAEKGHLYFGLMDAWAFSMETKCFRYWPGYLQGRRVGESIGPARMIHRSILERLDFNLFNGSGGSIDGRCESMVKSLGIHGTLIQAGVKPYRIGIKSDSTITKNLFGTDFSVNISVRRYFSKEIINLIYK